MTSSPKALTDDEADFLFHHVFFPPRLPGEIERSRDSYEVKLLKVFNAQITEWRELRLSGNDTVWQTVARTFSTWERVTRKDGKLIDKSILRALKELRVNDVFALNLSQQNAGIIFKGKKLGVVIERFLSAIPAKDVLKTAALKVTFPMKALIIDWNTFRNEAFLRELAKFLKALDADAESSFVDAEEKPIEAKTDIRNPEMVIELLMTILAAYGNLTNTNPILKKVRDNVSSVDKRTPWRRSSLYLTMKVVLRACLETHDGMKERRKEYKQFMLFFCNQLANLFSARPFLGDNLYVISLKLGRRTTKLGDSTSETLRGVLLQTTNKLYDRQKKTWETVKCNDVKSIQLLSDLPPYDIQMPLKESRRCIDEAIARDFVKNRVRFPIYHKVSRIFCDGENLPQSLDLISADDPEYFVLADFEHFVDQDLGRWMSSAEASVKNCIDLAELIKAYVAKTLRSYSGDAEHMSIMAITAFECWQALDVLVVRRNPLLGEYSPEIPPNILKDLVLRRTSDLQKLNGIEQHISNRLANSTDNLPSIFSGIENDCFGAKFFDGSSDLQRVREEMSAACRRKWEEKKSEWRSKSIRYEELNREAAALEHENTQMPSGKSWHRKKKCKKCMKEKEANEIDIEVHEALLPENEVLQKTMIFEHRCPPDILAWRDTTWGLLQDLFYSSRRSTSQKISVFDIASHENLRPWQLLQPRRLVLAAVQRPIYTRYRLPVDIEVLRVPNALELNYFDKTKNLWTTGWQSNDPDLAWLCNFSLPPGPYLESDLGKTVNQTSFLSNDLIASQAKCSRDLSLHEFLAFGSIRLGERIQWINILREVSGGSLQMNEPAIGIVLSRAIWHVGDQCDHKYLREVNGVFGDDTFFSTVFRVIQDSIKQLESNWEKHQAVEVVILLILKIISFCEDNRTANDFYELLKHLRNILIDWIDKLEQETGRIDTSVSELKRISAIRQCAWSYKLTFDGESACMQLGDDLDVKMFLRTSMVAHDRMPENISTEMRNAIIRSCRVTVRYEKQIMDWVMRNPLELSDLVSSKCESARRVKEWVISRENLDSGWIISVTEDETEEPLPEIIFNYLTGACFVNGCPVQRLPEEYTSHKMYQRLFRETVFDIILSDEQSMSYKTATRLFGWVIYFSMERNSDLIVRMKKDDQFFEVIPHVQFERQLPGALLDGYVHLLDLQRKIIEFRPLDSMWEANRDDWQMCYYSVQPVTLKRGGSSLFDFRGDTYQQVSDVFSALEDKEYIVAVYSHEAHEVQIYLPRFDLTFFVNKKRQFESRELGCVIDLDQDAGAFYGLKSKIILKSNGATPDHSRRKILIPYGKVEVNRLEQHVSVNISPNKADSEYRQYILLEIDPILGRLVSDNDIKCRLYLAYLHAVTSSQFPDPLMGVTGISEAIRILNQKSIHSSCLHSAEEIEILDLILRLAPRIDHSDKTETAQSSQWINDISVHSQLVEFAYLVQRIDGENRKLTCLYDQPSRPSLRSRGNVKLLERHRVLNAWTYTNEIPVSENLVGEYNYIEQECEGSSHAYKMSDVFRRWPSGLDGLPIAWSLVKGLKVVHLQQPFTWESLATLLRLKVTEDWGPLFKLCFHARPADRYSLSFLFATILYSDPNLYEHCKFLISCALCDFSSHSIGEPEFHKCHPIKGEKPDMSEVDSVIQDHHITFQRHARSNFEPEEKATVKNEPQHREDLRNAAEVLRKLVETTWKRGDSRLRDAPTFVNIDMEGCISSLNNLLTICLRNRKFHVLILKIATLLDGLKDPRPLPETSRADRPPATPITEDSGV